MGLTILNQNRINHICSINRICSKYTATPLNIVDTDRNVSSFPVASSAYTLSAPTTLKLKSISSSNLISSSNFPRSFSTRSFSKMAYNFASSGYAAQFGNLPEADGKWLRDNAATYVKNFDRDLWHKEPQCTILNGYRMPEGITVDTVDAFNRPNGKAIHSPAHVVDAVIGHIKNYKPPQTDLRAPIRAIDMRFCTTLAPEIIGNQTIDFEKQDPITEIEESVQANKVEWRLNDQLFEAEKRGEVVIRRDPVLIAAVSNFSNFLDLFRKALRHLEMGVPVVVLSRSNTSQHGFRWTVLILDLLKEFNIDVGMITFLSCDINSQRKVFSACQNSPCHFTGSRDVAQKIREICPKLVSSTGGPNTLVATKFNDKIGDALRWSNLIENKGQCTALRHFVCPELTKDHLNQAYSKTNVVKNGLDAMEQGEFAGILDGPMNQAAPVEGYSKLDSQPLVNYRLNGGGEFPAVINEQWRQIYVDATTVDSAATLLQEGYINKLAAWLNEKQPISLGVNHDNYELALRLFEKTGMVVYTVGDFNNPAMTCQARPQEGECFGEFPPRHMMDNITSVPMIIPSPVAAYNSVYSESFLAEKAACPSPLDGLHEDAVKMIRLIRNDRVRAYASVLMEYLLDACEPKAQFNVRSCLFGLQRPPIGNLQNYVRLESSSNAGRLLLYLLPYVATTAVKQVEVRYMVDNAVAAIAAKQVSISGPICPRITAEIQRNFKITVESNSEFEKRKNANSFYNSATVDKAIEMILAQQFISKLFPMGHIKSTYPKDSAFVEYFRKSAKWLRIRKENFAAIKA